LIPFWLTWSWIKLWRYDGNQICKKKEAQLQKGDYPVDPADHSPLFVFQCRQLAVGTF
jgi:hypothetical protein